LARVNGFGLHANGFGLHANGVLEDTDALGRVKNSNLYQPGDSA
jgi:hypothetical protein